MCIMCERAYLAKAHCHRDRAVFARQDRSPCFSLAPTADEVCYLMFRSEYYGALLAVVEHLCLPTTHQLLQPVPAPTGGCDLAATRIHADARRHVCCLCLVLTALAWPYRGGAQSPWTHTVGLSLGLSTGALNHEVKLLHPCFTLHATVSSSCCMLWCLAAVPDSRSAAG